MGIVLMAIDSAPIFCLGLVLALGGLVGSMSGVRGRNGAICGSNATSEKHHLNSKWLRR